LTKVKRLVLTCDRTGRTKAADYAGYTIAIFFCPTAQGEIMGTSWSIFRLMMTLWFAFCASFAQAAIPRPFSLQDKGFFEENRGQYPQDALFRARFKDLDALLRIDGSMSLYPRQGRERHELRLVHLGANGSPKIEGDNETTFRTNYFRGPGQTEAVADVRNFESVKIERLYPGIDLVAHSMGATLEFDYIVSSGANPSAIALKIDGSNSIRLAPSGDLAIERDGVTVHQRKPVAYQIRDGVRTQIDCAYRLSEDGRIGFALGSYDRSLALVIDPLVDYSSYLGGASEDTPRGARIGPDGYLYVAGTTSSSNFPTSAAYDSTLGGSSDAFVTKINPATGKAVWSTYLGGSNADSGIGLAVDSSGGAYVTGIAGSRFPTTTGAYQTSASGTYGFVTKLSTTGSLVYSTLVSGAQPSAIEVDPQGEAVVVGSSGSGFVTTAGAFSRGFSGPAAASSGDAFVLKLNSTGTGAVFATFFGGTGTDVANSVAIDGLGQIVIGGSTQSANLPLSTSPAPLQPVLKGGQDAFAAIFSSNGAALAFSTYFGGSASDEIVGVALDPYGNLVVAGNTQSADYPTTNPLLAVGDLTTYYVNAFGGGPIYQKGFLAKWSLGSSPSVVFSTFTGGRIDCCDAVQALAVDGNGDIFLSGSSRVDSYRLLSSINAYVPPSIVYNDYAANGGTDALFAAAYLRDGTDLRFQGYIAGCVSSCNPSAMFTKGAGLALIAGSTRSNWVPIAAANTQPVQPSPNVADSGFLTMLSFEPPALDLIAFDSFSNTATPISLKVVSSVPGASGTVTLWDGSTSIGTANAVEGIAHFNVTLPLGVRQLKATLGTGSSPTVLMPVAVSGGSCQ
jgi:hypothetical protein